MFGLITITMASLILILITPKTQHPLCLVSYTYLPCVPITRVMLCPQPRIFGEMSVNYALIIMGKLLMSVLRAGKAYLAMSLSLMATNSSNVP